MTTSLVLILIALTGACGTCFGLIGGLLARRRTEI